MNTITHDLLITNNANLMEHSFQELSKFSDQVITCESKIIMDLPYHYIVNKKCDNGSIIFLTMDKINGNWQLVRGYVYQNNQEIPIKDYVLYRSIQLGDWCCDSLGICFI
jgi:hypothetical protein